MAMLNFSSSSKEKIIPFLLDYFILIFGITDVAQTKSRTQEKGRGTSDEGRFRPLSQNTEL